MRTWIAMGSVLALLAASGTSATASPGAKAELTLPLALELARTALAACEHRGQYGSAAVVDAAGVPLVVLRSSRSAKPPVAAPRKAATAAFFRAPGSELEQRAAHDPAFAAQITAEPDRLNDHPGSMPLFMHGILAGGLAVADVPHDQADRCVRDAVSKLGGKLR